MRRGQYKWCNDKWIYDEQANKKKDEEFNKKWENYGKQWGNNHSTNDTYSYWYAKNITVKIKLKNCPIHREVFYQKVCLKCQQQAESLERKRLAILLKAV
jgi:hypothetical protein